MQTQSSSKFGALLREVLLQGPKKVKDLYQVIAERQPQDCTDTPCTHRKKVSASSLEWQHRLRRELGNIAENRDGLWQLRPGRELAAAAAAGSSKTTTTDASTGETEAEEPTDEPAIGVSSVVEAADKPYTGDRIDRDPETGHFIGDDGFRVPRDFNEFYERYPHYIRNWVKRRLGNYVVEQELEDWTQDLIIHMKYLPANSKHRLPGTNGRPNGCTDVIETFNPYSQYGASERRFRSYVNMCLSNKFNTVHTKSRKNPICRPGNLTIVGTLDTSSTAHRTVDGCEVTDEYLHSNSQHFSRATVNSQKRDEDKLYVNQFRSFVERQDPTALEAIDAIAKSSTHGDAARMLGIDPMDFSRLRSRLKQLAECFVTGEEVPNVRKPYKRRVLELEAVSS